MKTIQTPAVITTISSRQDGSLRFSAETPEYTDTEFTEFRRLQGKNVSLTIKPTDEAPEEEMEVEGELEGKPRHIRLRNSLYVLWDKVYRDTYPDFDDFYKAKLDRLIEDIQSKIPVV